MFPQLRKINNESGVVLFIVLMTAIIIMIFSVGVLTESSNEVNYAQQQIDQIQSDELAKGMYWYSYASIVSGGALPGNIPVPLSGRTYTMSITSPASANSVLSNYEAVATYDTF